MLNLLAVFIGGGLGSISRYGIAEWIRLTFPSNFPVATFISNLLSCLILALSILMLHEKMSTQPILRLLLITGFCGGFSTFSSFSFETVDLLKSEQYLISFANITISVFTCTALVYLILKNQ